MTKPTNWLRPAKTQIRLGGSESSLCTQWVAKDPSFLHVDSKDSDQTGQMGERGGSVVECRTPEREVGGSKPTAAVLCPWARHFTPRKYWLITQEAVAPSRYDWKIVDWDVKPQHNQPTKTGQISYGPWLMLKFHVCSISCGPIDWFWKNL